MLVSFVFAVVLAASGVADAEATPPPPPPQPAAAPAKPAPKEEKVVCKYEAETGSRFSKKVCMTPSQMKARRDEARKAVSDLQTNAGIAP